MSIALLRINGLALYAYHGVHEAERALGQRFLIDIVATVDVGSAPRTDDIAESVDYAGMIEVATIAFTSRAFNLIESAAGTVAEEVLRRFEKVVSVSVTVHKPAAPVAAIVADISATVEARRDD